VEESSLETLARLQQKVDQLEAHFDEQLVQLISLNETQFVKKNQSPTRRQMNLDNDASFEYDEDSYDASEEGRTTSFTIPGRKKSKRNELPSEAPLQIKGVRFLCAIPILETLNCLEEMEKICGRHFDNDEDVFVEEYHPIPEGLESSIICSPDCDNDEDVFVEEYHSILEGLESTFSSDASTIHSTNDTETRTFNLDNMENSLKLSGGDLSLVVEESMSEAMQSPSTSSGTSNAYTIHNIQEIENQGLNSFYKGEAFNEFLEDLNIVDEVKEDVQGTKKEIARRGRRSYFGSHAITFRIFGYVKYLYH
jgi:hypothetical protein